MRGSGAERVRLENIKCVCFFVIYRRSLEQLKSYFGNYFCKTAVNRIDLRVRKAATPLPAHVLRYVHFAEPRKKS